MLLNEKRPIPFEIGRGIKDLMERQASASSFSINRCSSSKLGSPT